MDKSQRYIYQKNFRLGENSSIPSGFIGPILPLPPSSIFLGHRQLQGGSPGERAVRIIFRCHTEYVSPPTNTTYIKKKLHTYPVGLVKARWTSYSLEWHPQSVLLAASGGPRKTREYSVNFNFALY